MKLAITIWVLVIFMLCVAWHDATAAERYILLSSFERGGGHGPPTYGTL